MPSSAVKGVLAAVSIAFGSCAGLFAAVSGTGEEICTTAEQRSQDCGVGASFTIPGGSCDGINRCFSECVAGASCQTLNLVANGNISDPSAAAFSQCLNGCVGK
jgi:hypothetical protein